MFNGVLRQWQETCSATLFPEEEPSSALFCSWIWARLGPCALPCVGHCVPGWLLRPDGAASIVGECKRRWTRPLHSFLCWFKLTITAGHAAGGGGDGSPLSALSDAAQICFFWVPVRIRRAPAAQTALLHAKPLICRQLVADVQPGPHFLSFCCCRRCWIPVPSEHQQTDWQQAASGARAAFQSFYLFFSNAVIW